MSAHWPYPTEGEFTGTFTLYPWGGEFHREMLRDEQNRREILAALHDYQARTNRPRRPKYHPLPLP